MPGPAGGRTTESRLDLLEYQAKVAISDIEDLRRDMNTQLDRVDQRLGRILFAGWALIASIIGGAAAMVVAAAVLR